jgi:hypothetical protein
VNPEYAPAWLERMGNSSAGDSLPSPGGACIEQAAENTHPEEAISKMVSRLMQRS